MSFGTVCGFSPTKNKAFCTKLERSGKKDKHQNILEVTQTCIESFLRNACVNERYRGNGR